MMKFISLWPGCFLLMFLIGCSHKASTDHQEQLLQATLWYQQSAELQAIFWQTYYLAERELGSRMGKEYDKPPAVVLDIDETVLDNSPHSARQIIDDRGFNNDMWDEWCMLGAAKPLPGALDFTNYASNLGAEVFYISNRGIHLLDATLGNLRKAGFPDADSAHVLLMTGDSGKESRRRMVGETHQILMLVGDNLGDFSEIFDERSNGADRHAVEELRDSFGTVFILLPNPMYGGWEKPFRGESPLETLLLKKEALEPYATQKE